MANFGEKNISGNGDFWEQPSEDGVFGERSLKILLFGGETL